VLTYTLGTAQDKIVLSGASSNLTLDGTINVTAGAGFVGGVFDLITYNGTLTNNTLAIGTLPSGYNGAINVDTTLKKIQIVLTGGIVAMREYPRGVGRGIMRGII
jgi:succinyl-CoA synthetase beta subunit